MVFKRPPVLRLWVHGIAMVPRYYASVLRLLAAARREGKPASVRAHCDDEQTANEWERCWSLHGVVVERLLGHVCYFELGEAQLHRMPDLPRPRPEGPFPTVTLAN